MLDVYSIQSLKNRSFYTGSPSNPRKRIIEHNQKISSYAKKFSPWKSVHFEGHSSRKDALCRKHRLKLHRQGLRRIKERLGQSFLV